MGAEETRSAANEASRSLFGDGHDEDHDHFDHDHSDHDHSDHDHTHHFDPSNTEGALADLHRSLRGSELRIGKRRRVQGASYAYWVDVYVEIDKALCTDNGDTCATGIGTNTINYGEFRFFLMCWSRFVRAYLPLTPAIMSTNISFSLHSVNAIFTGANTIYEVSVQHHLCLFESVNPCV